MAMRVGPAYWHLSRACCETVQAAVKMPGAGRPREFENPALAGGPAW
jgi:hypothetical protein